VSAIIHALNRAVCPPVVCVLRRMEMTTGKVKWFSDAKGYGFIQADEEDLNTRDIFVITAHQVAGDRGRSNTPEPDAYPIVQAGVAHDDMLGRVTRKKR